MDEIFKILLIISALCWLSGFWFLFRIPRCSVIIEKQKYPAFSIIIPARNEEYNIGKIIDSIQSQTLKPNEIIVVNDSSSDMTKTIAEEKGAKVLDVESPPKGWLGKPWACYNGAMKSVGDLLFFLDSDVTIEENGLKKIIDTYLYYSERSAARFGIAMSISPYHRVVEFYEEFSAIFNIIMNGSMNAFTPNKKAIVHGLFGQSLLISRENYYRIDGHDSVKHRILENMFMAQVLQNNGVELKCFGGKDSLSFRMYGDGFKALINGWSKAFAMGAARIPLLSLLNIIVWINGAFIIFILTLGSLFSGQNIGLCILLYIAQVLQLYWMLIRVGSFRIVTAIFYPIHLVFYTIVFARSLSLKIRKKSIKWKSREVVS